MRRGVKFPKLISREVIPHACTMQVRYLPRMNSTSEKMKPAISAKETIE
jgi:hypothetical protein